MTKKKTLGTTLAAVALAVIGIAGNIAPASAYIYRSEFDPIEFLGVAYFDVSPGCFLGEKDLVSNNGGSCTVIWQSATVTLKDTESSASYTFDYAAVLPDALAVTAVLTRGNDELLGVVSDWIGPRIINSDTVPSADSMFWGNWLLSYGLSGNEDPVFLTKCNFDGETCYPVTAPPIEATTVTFTRVPEPGTLGLVLGAVAAGWFSRRRRAAS